MKPYVYNCKLVKIVEGDTIDVDIDLGFGVCLKKQRIRLEGINAPESRTRDMAEKKLGLLAKSRLSAILMSDFVVKTTLDKKGKFGRIIGTPYVGDTNVCELLVTEGHARVYDGGKRESWT